MKEENPEEIKTSEPSDEQGEENQIDDNQNLTNQIETGLPEGFPYRAELAENDIETIEALQKLTRKEIIGLKKIGIRKAVVIAKKLAEIVEPVVPKSAEELDREARNAFEEEQRKHYTERMKREKAS